MLDVAKYLDLAKAGMRWDQLPVANGNSVVITPDAEAKVLPQLSKLLLDQGCPQHSTEGSSRTTCRPGWARRRSR